MNTETPERPPLEEFVEQAQNPQWAQKHLKTTAAYAIHLEAQLAASQERGLKALDIITMSLAMNVDFEDGLDQPGRDMMSALRKASAALNGGEDG